MSRLFRLFAIFVVLTSASLPPALAGSSIIRSFVNGTTDDVDNDEVHDLHIEYTHAIRSVQLVGSSTAGPTISINQNQRQKVDVVFTRKLGPGESIGISAASDSNKLGIKTWWWTKSDGSKARRNVRWEHRGRTRNTTITDYGPQHRGDEPRLPAPNIDLHTIKNKSHHWDGAARLTNPVKITMDIRPLILNPRGLDADKLKDNIKKAVTQWTDCTKLRRKGRVPKAGQNGNPKNHGHQFARDPAVMAPGPTHQGAKGKKFRSVTVRECDAAFLKYPRGLDVNFIEMATDTAHPDIRTGWGVPAKFGGALGAGPSEPDGSDKDKTKSGSVFMRPPGSRIKWHLATNTEGDTNDYLTNKDADVVPDDHYDFYSVFKHEFGHVICLHHSGVNFTDGANGIGEGQPADNGTASPHNDCCPHGHSQGDHEEDSGDPDGAADSFFFSSDRPGGLGGLDIWISERDEEGQWIPRNLGPAINSPFDEVDPFLAGDGTWLLFSSNRQGGTAGFAIYETIFDLENDQWREAGLLPGVNSQANDRHPSLQTDQRTLFFYSDRPGGFGGADIWTAELIEGLGFAEPTNLGDQVNSPFNDGDPTISGDGVLLMFASDRPGGFGGLDIYRTVLTPDGWEQPGNVVEINTQFNELHPAIVSSNEWVFFSSDRPGGAGQLDVYQARIISEPPQVLELFGVAAGGLIDINVNGPAKTVCSTSVETVAGQSATAVAAAIADALATDPCVTGQGVRVTLQDNAVLIAAIGMTPDDVAVFLLDAGLATDPITGPPGSLLTTALIGLDRGLVGDDVRIAWPPSCSTEAIDYGIYEGDLTTLRAGGGYNHAFVDCLDNGSDRVEDVAPQFAASYFLVVPNDLNVEGGYGSDSTGTPRPRGDAACVPEQDSSCPQPALRTVTRR